MAGRTITSSMDSSRDTRRARTSASTLAPKYAVRGAYGVSSVTGRWWGYPYTPTQLTKTKRRTPAAAAARSARSTSSMFESR